MTREGRGPNVARIARPIVSRVLLVALVALIGPPSLHAGTSKTRKPPKVPSLKSKAKAEIKKLISEYFKIGDEGDRKTVLEGLAGHDPVPKSVVSGFRNLAFARAMAGPRLVVKHKTTFVCSGGTGVVLINGVKRNKMQPLLIGLHGGGAGAGDGATSEQKWQSAVGKGCICVFPTVLRKENSAWNREREEKYVIDLIEAVKRTCRVDTNRIYLVGHSMGGYGTWSIGGHYADLFAALSPNAGGLFVIRGGSELRLPPGIIGNLHNTPVYFFHSTDDPRVPAASDQLAAKALGEFRKIHTDGYKHVYKEYGDIGHGMPKDGVGPILKYVLSFERDPYPAKVVFEPTRAYKRFFAWIELLPGSPIRRIEATHDRKANTLNVKTEGGEKGFALYLDGKKMIDPKREVIVTINGKEAFRDFVSWSVASLVRSV
ncbi:MAG: carboxylesterase family protein, partial [Planctomycetota bacterium]